jgi:hypothetical protein
MHVRSAFCALLITLPAFQQDSTALSDVMLRVHGYVVGYEKDLSGVMSEERWVQRIVARDGQIVAERTLRSDYLVFQLPPDEDWFTFRDVFEVDGQPVADREQRFRELFTRGPSSAVEQAMKIAAENARYNLGDVYRTINVPTFVLTVLRPMNRARFVFEKVGEESIDGTSTWIVSYKEIKKPTFIKSETGKALMSQGRLWVDPSNGRVVKTELVVGGVRSVRDRATIVVTYGPQADLGIWVPIEMTELYDKPSKPKAERVAGSAIYSNFRRSDLKNRLEATGPTQSSTVKPPRRGAQLR